MKVQTLKIVNLAPERIAEVSGGPLIVGRYGNSRYTVRHCKMLDREGTFVPIRVVPRSINLRLLKGDEGF